MIILKRKVIPFILLILLGLFARTYIQFKHISWILGGGGPTLEELAPGYLLFILLAITVSIVLVIKCGFKSMRIIIGVTWIIILSFTIMDVGKDFYYEVDNHYAEIKVNKLKDYYEKKNINGLRFVDVIWATQEQTVYVFVKDGEISEKHIDDIIKTIKPVDNLDVTIELVSRKDKKHMIYRFSNNKKFKNIEYDSLLERIADDYLKN